MLTSLNQRWRNRRDSYRPAGEVIDTSSYEVAVIASDKVAKAFIARHHYAGSGVPPLRRRFGLYRSGELVGVAGFSVPQNKFTYKLLPGERPECADLGRLVLLDDVPANGETWFLARCFEALRAEGFRSIVSFSDPIPRTNRDGGLSFTGHIGTIYQASNAIYMGLSKAETKFLLPDGTTIPSRSLAKIRKLDSGWQKAVAKLVAFGACPLDPARQDPVAWVSRWRDAVCRPFKHSGNHKYAWALQRADRRQLRRTLTSLPYPKMNRGQLTLAGVAA